MKNQFSDYALDPRTVNVDGKRRSRRNVYPI